jgi:hypothetical protein
MVLAGNDVMADPLDARRALLERHVLPTLSEQIRYAPARRAVLLTLCRRLMLRALKGLLRSTETAGTYRERVRGPGASCALTAGRHS